MSFVVRCFQILAACGLAALALLPEPAAAQNRGRAACFFEHADFAGRRMCIGPGQRVPYVGEALNDRFSSVSVPAGMRVVMCEDINFGGRCLELDESVRDFRALDRWNDRVSSIAAEAEGRGPARPAAEPGATTTARRAQVCFYEDEDFRGRAYCAAVGAAVRGLGEFNDRFSSMEAPPGVVVTACEHSNFRGVCLRLEGAVPTLGQLWKNRISSFRSARN